MKSDAVTVAKPVVIHVVTHVVVMGVAGCGKSAVGQRIAAQLNLPLIEGDDFHPAGNIQKMQQGIALTDDDRVEWLQTLGVELASHPDGVVLTCSALKKAYRDQLRAALPGLRFVHLELSREEARTRVAQRAGGHYFQAGLVDSQFEALEPPHNEAGVRVVDATQSLAALAPQIVHWIQKAPHANN